MKRITITLIAITLIMFLIMGCDKDKYHRDRYIGDWDFVTVTITQIENDSGWKIVNRDTIYYPNS